MGVLTGIVMLVVGLWATHRFLRSGTIKAYETGLRYRGVTNSKRLSWASVDSFVCTPGRSGYGGRGVVLSVVVADGKQLIKFGEFWAPEDAGSRFWPDCEGICSELNELLAAYRRSADMSTGGDDQRPEQ